MMNLKTDTTGENGEGINMRAGVVTLLEVMKELNNLGA